MAYVDTLIIGAGVSGLGIAAHLTRHHPQRSLAILERRSKIGGTWDLFKYPGIRSDSDMLTFGFNFKPWNKDSVLASAAAIKQYLNEVIDEYHLSNKIHFEQRVLSANYDSEQQQWSVEVQQNDGSIQTWHSQFLLGCTGYYNYDQGYQPEFVGQENFKGQWVHPQHWPEHLDYQGKKVVVIGSGATAMTVVPALANSGVGHVTLLQRSPTYVLSIASGDALYQKARQVLPETWAYRAMRARNIGLQRAMYVFARKQPKLMRNLLLHLVKQQLEGKVDLKHFRPDYQPWDQRLCVVPNGDLFTALKSSQADIVTDQIERITEQGILLQSGQQLEADIIVCATGLQIQVLGGLDLSVDGQRIDYGQSMLYRGMMLSNVPNLAIAVGYTNSPWTLKVDLVADYLSRLFTYMQQHHFTEVVAKNIGVEQHTDTVMNGLNSGYLQRAVQLLPKQGKHPLWQVGSDYLKDRFSLKRAPFEDEALRFKTATQAQRANAARHGQIG